MYNIIQFLQITPNLKQMQNFEFSDYTVTCSFNGPSIFIKLINKFSYACYEADINYLAFDISFDVDVIYQLICNCFKQHHGFDCKIELNRSDCMRLKFTAKIEVNEKLTLLIPFEAILKEKVLSNDAQVSITLHRMEQRCTELMERISELEKWVESSVSNAEIILYNGSHSSSGQFYVESYPANIRELELNQNIDYKWNKIQHFMRLKQLTLISPNGGYLQNLSNMCSCSVELFNLNNFGSFTSFVGLRNFPELRMLQIKSCNAVSDLVAQLSSYEHKIKHITVTSCAKINSVELMTYCQVNRIELVLT